jgi:protein-disulfide isomerase
MKTPSIPPSKLTTPLPGRDHIQGPADALFTLVEYGDYECPFCGEAYPIIKEVQERLGGKLCFAYRNFPLANIHPHSIHAAEAAEAADEQKHFWEMHDLLFENQTALEDPDLARYAQELGLNAERLMSDVLTDHYVARLREDFKGGTRSGVNGTPTLFVNGQRYDGPRDVELLIAAITQSPSRDGAVVY